MIKRARNEIDVTDGPLLPKLLRFSLPMMVTSILQLLYSAADMAIVGQFSGKEALAAVGASSPLINLLTTLFIGMALGGNVIIAQAHGARDEDGVSSGTHTIITAAILMGGLLLLIGLITSRPLLHMTDTPDDVIDLAALYLRIYFLGMPASMLYNYGAGLMRAMGDTRRPMIYLSTSGIVNVLLNLLTVIVFKMGVAGVALATIASQYLSAGFVLHHLLHTHTGIRLNPQALRIEKKYLRELIRIGLPAGLQSCLFSIGNLVIAAAINAQGATVIAGNTAAGNLESFVNCTMTAVGQTLLTFSGTNLGAKKYARVRKGYWVGMGTAFVLGLSLGLLLLPAGKTLLGLYNSDPDVIVWGMKRLSIVLPTYFLCGLMNVSTNHMRGIGHSFSPMIISITGACGFRILWVYTVFAAHPSMTVLYLVFPVSWALTFIAVLIAYYLGPWKKIRRQELAQAAGT